MTVDESQPCLVWTDPPLNAPRISPWRERLAPLIERPGEWAQVYANPTLEKARSMVGRLRGRHKYPVALPDGKWEFAARRIEANKRPAGVWARYVGPT